MKRADYITKLRSVVKYTAILLLFIGMNHSTAIAQLSNLVVTPQQTSTNFYSKYTFDFTTGNGKNNELGTSNVITLTFPTEVTLPSSIAASEVTISYSGNGTASGNPSSVSISGDVVTLGIPFSIPKGVDISVSIAESADIRNPSSAITPTFTVDTDNTAQPHDPINDTVTFTATSTQVTSAAVTPNPSVEQRTAKYTVSFQVGQGGYLTKNTSTITLTFPAGTTVPSGGISGIKINSTTASANGSGNELVITTPVNIDNSGSVSVTIPEGAGFRNPNAGDYTLDVRTSSESTDVTSSTYSISSLDDISFSSITASNDTVNAISAYDITFITSDDLDGDPNNKGAIDQGEYIVLFFPSEFTIPSNISTSNVTVQNDDSGFASSADGLTVSSSAAGDTLFIQNPIDIDDGQSVTVTLSENIGIQQPVVTGNYQLSASTRETGSGETPTIFIDRPEASNPFAIDPAASTISTPSVSIANSNTGAATTYTLDFTTGKYGRLLSGTSTVTVTFPGDYDLTTLGTVNVNSTTASTTTSGQDVIITVPGSVDINNSNAVNLTIDINNPGSPNSYDLGVATSVESTVVNSTSFSIGGTSLNSLSLTTSNGLVNQADAFNFQFTDPATYQKNNSGYFKFVFPASAELPSSISNGDVTFTDSNGGFTLTSVSTDQSTNTVTVNFDTPGAGNNFSGVTFDVDFAAAANIVNPPIPKTGYYNVGISSNKSIQESTIGFDVASNSNTSVTIDDVALSPTTKSLTDVQYQVDFTTGIYGKLVGGISAGSSEIDITFDGTGTTVPGTISTNDVTINGSAPSSVSVSGNTVTLGMPNGMNISSSSSATVIFKTSAGLDNGSTSGNYTLTVTTTSTTNNTNTTYTLTDTSPLSLGSFNKNNNTVNAASSYSINFTPGTNGALASADNDYVEITFPSNTFLPPSFAKQYALIEGTQVSNATVSGNTLRLYTPDDLSAGTEASISISSTAGILNPTLVGSTYKFELATSQEATPVESTSYSTTATSSTVSTPDVSLSDYGLSATGVTYTITFDSGEFGRLIEELNGEGLTASTIFVNFHSDTDISGVTNTDVDVNGGQPSSVTVSSNVLEIPTPEIPTDSIWNVDDVTITIAGIQNPGSADDYTLDVKTSVENSYITSTSYPITSAQPLSTSNFTLTNQEVNQAGIYQFDFTPSTNMTGGSDTITLTFPESSEVPGTIANADIEIDNTAANSVSTNSLNRTVTITIPNGITSGSTATLEVLQSADVINPKEPANDYTLSVKTSTQPVSSQTDFFTLSEASNSSIQNLGISVSPDNTVTEPVTWTWGFSTGPQGALKPGTGSIYLNFDQSDYSEVPDPMPTTAITVNGEQISDLTYPYNGQDNVLRITVPSNVTIGNEDNVTVIVSDAAGIKVDSSLEKVKSGNSGSGDQTLASNNYTADTSAEGGGESTSNPLPITITSFQADIPEGRDEPVVRWTTATERENFGFYIDRTYLGPNEKGKSQAYADTNWSEIHFMKGAGTTTSEQTYEFKDESVNQAGVYLYRIRQVDNDGVETFYGPIELQYEAPDQFKLNQNYPNPFNPTTKIEYSVAQQSQVRIDVYNVLGQKVQTLVNREQFAGTYNVQFDGQALASGMYLVRMMANGNVFTKKMMLMK